MTAGPDHREGVAAWQEHLRQGGRTPWREFSPTPASVPDRLGSAVHLELIRRLDSTLPRFAELADLVLATSTPGRGSVDVPVAGASPPGPGAPPVDPEQLDDEELLRLATAVLAPMVMAEPRSEESAPRARLFGRRFRVWGAPLARAQLRRALLARGWRESTSGGTTFVIGSPLVDGVAQVWTRRIESGSQMTWPRLWRRLEARDRLPSSLDFSAMVETARLVGGRVVPIVGSMAHVAEQVQEQLGLTIPGQPDLVAIDVVRRLNAVLGTRVPDSQRHHLTPAIRTIVAESATPITALAVPVARRDWARRAADPVAGYAHDEAAETVRVPADRALELALAAIGRGWTRQRPEEET